MGDAGIVHQNVQISESAAFFLDKLCGTASIADIGCNETAILVPKNAGSGLARRGIDIGNDDTCSFGDEASSNGEPDAVRSASDDGNPVFKLHPCTPQPALA
jgi:hypothetical protein